MRPLELRGSDGVTSRPRDGVTSDVIGHLPAEELPVWELVFGIKNLAPPQDVDVDLPSLIRKLEHLVGEDRAVDKRRSSIGP